MRATRILACAAGLLLAGSMAWAQNVTLRGTSPQGGAVSVSLSRTDATALKDTATRLQRAGCDTYLSLWAKRGTSRSYPQGSGALLVTNVRNKGQWLDEYAKNTVGFVSNGSPLSPGYSGYVRIGDMLFTYNAIRAGEWHDHTYAVRPESMRQYSHEHVESTFDVSPTELAAFKAFYFARANAAVLDPRTGQVHLPEWENPGSSNWRKEGCAGASTSSLNRDWMRAFRYSIQNIRQKGQQLNIPEMANATAEMADVITSFMSRTGLKQCTTPKALVREFALKSPAGGKISIINAPTEDIPRSFMRDFQWDQHHPHVDGDFGWNGLGRYPMLPDLNQSARGSGAFRSVRVDPVAALSDALR